MTKLEEATVALVGLGLMGGSLAAALASSARVQRVVGAARRPDTVREALARGLIDDGTCDAAVACAGADVVIFATPVQSTVALLDELGPTMRPGTIVSDMGSTKASVMAAMSRLPVGLEPVGGHPMCGKEVAGLSAADGSLFQGKVYVLTPLERTAPEATRTMQELVQAVGARSLLLDPARHDRLVAAISHLPYIVAACLFAAAQDEAVADPLVWELVASGFKDTTRLAGSEPVMMRDILMTNQENVLHLIDLFGRRLNEMSAYLSHDDSQSLTRFMSDVRQRREELFQ